MWNNSCLLFLSFKVDPAIDDADESLKHSFTNDVDGDDRGEINGPGTGDEATTTLENK